MQDSVGIFCGDAGPLQHRREALQIGVFGIVDRCVSGKTLIQILDNVRSGKTYIDPTLTSSLLLYRFERDDSLDVSLSSLSAREIRILKEVANGQTNKEIARSQQLAVKTVKHYMTSILHKLRVRNRVEAALVAREQWEFGSR